MEHWFAQLYAGLNKCRAQYEYIPVFPSQHRPFQKSYIYSVVDIFLVLSLLLYTLVFIVHLFMFILLSFYLLTKKKVEYYFFVKYFYLEFILSHCSHFLNTVWVPKTKTRF